MELIKVIIVALISLSPVGEEMIAKISSLLGNKQVRRAWEKKEPVIAAQEIKKRLLKQK